MTVKQFVNLIKTLDSRFRFIPGPRRASGLYLNVGQGHPGYKDFDIGDDGLLWVAAIPSPSHFSTLPKQDWYSNGGKDYNRGWLAIVQKLVSDKVITKQQAKSTFGSEVFA